MQNHNFPVYKTATELDFTFVPTVCKRTCENWIIRIKTLFCMHFFNVLLQMEDMGKTLSNLKFGYSTMRNL